MNELSLDAHLRQDAADLPAVYHNVIRPLDARLDAAGLPDALRHGERHEQCHHGCLVGRVIRFQDQREIDIDARRAVPCPAASAAPRRLHVRHEQCSLRCAVLRVQLCLHIRGADLGIKGDGMTCPLRLHAAVQLILPEDLILRQKNIALVLHRFNVIAFLFQLVDRLPHSSPRNTEALTELLSRQITAALPEKRQYLCFHSFSHLFPADRFAAPLCQSCVHDRLDRVHAVFRLIEDK